MGKLKLTNRTVPKTARNKRIYTTTGTSVSTVISTSSTEGTSNYTEGNGIDITSSVISLTGNYTGDFNITGDFKIDDTIISSSNLSDSDNIARLDTQFPMGCTDNSLCRFNGSTGKIIQSSMAKIDDYGNLDITGIYKVDGSQISLSDIAGVSNLVTNLGASTDNAIARFDGTTGKIIQNSNATIDDEGAITGISLNSPDTFISGYDGEGTKLDLVEDSLTLDSLTVRQEMNIYELVINKIRATNGSLWVTDSNKVIGVTEIYIDEALSYYKLDFDTEANIPHTFTYNDVIRVQRWTGRNVKVAEYIVIDSSLPTVSTDDYGIINGVDTTYVLVDIATGYGIPEVNDEFVRVNNTADTDRKGALYLTSSEDNSPFMDIIYDSTTIMRVGKLDGITDTVRSNSGYGIWGSTNGADVDFVISSDGYAQISSWNFDKAYLWSGTKQESDAFTTDGITIGNGALRAKNFRIDTDGSAYFNGNISASSGDIGGWNISSLALYKDNSTNSAGLAPNDYPFYAGNTYSNRATAPFRVSSNGDINITSEFNVSNSNTGCEVRLGNNTFPDFSNSGAIYAKGTASTTSVDTNAIHAVADGGQHSYAIKAEALGSNYNYALWARASGGSGSNFAALLEGDVKINYGKLFLTNGGIVYPNIGNYAADQTYMSSSYNVFVISNTINITIYLPSITNYEIGEIIYVTHLNDNCTAYVKQYNDTQTINNYTRSEHYIALSGRNAQAQLMKRTSNDWVLIGGNTSSF